MEGLEVMAKNIGFLVGVVECSKSRCIDGCMTEYAEIHATVCFRRVNCVACELYPKELLKKAVFPIRCPKAIFYC